MGFIQWFPAESKKGRRLSKRKPRIHKFGNTCTPEATRLPDVACICLPMPDVPRCMLCSGIPLGVCNCAGYIEMGSGVCAVIGICKGRGE